MVSANTWAAYVVIAVKNHGQTYEQRMDENTEAVVEKAGSASLSANYSCGRLFHLFKKWKL